MTAWEKSPNRYDINLVKAYDINSVRNSYDINLVKAYDINSVRNTFEMGSERAALGRKRVPPYSTSRRSPETGGSTAASENLLGFRSGQLATLAGLRSTRGGSRRNNLHNHA